MAKASNKRARAGKPIQLQINDLQKQLNVLKGKVDKKQGGSQQSVHKPNILGSLGNVDPAKITEWLTLLSNPAVQEIIGQWKGKSAQAEEPRRRSRRRMLF